MAASAIAVGDGHVLLKPAANAQADMAKTSVNAPWLASGKRSLWYCQRRAANEPVVSGCFSGGERSVLNVFVPDRSATRSAARIQVLLRPAVYKVTWPYPG